MSATVARRRRSGAAFDLLAAYEAPDGFHFEREGIGVSAPSVHGGVEIGPEPDLRALARRDRRGACAS